MRVRHESKIELARAMHPRYVHGSRQEKGRLLDEFVAVTGYHRKYALGLLRHGVPPRVVGHHPGRRARYGPRVVAALQVAATATGWICGKRLAAALPELVPALEQEGALHLAPDDRARLLAISAATIDRHLRAARQGTKPKGLATTKPGSLLKRQVPIRTYTPWDEQRAGFVEIDLVAHGGTSTAGDFLYTLDVVDLATGWTECVGLPNRSQEAVFAALQQVRARLPFPLLGLDSDNGAEFINAQLIRYCERERITLTRCRAYHKNDQAHVEAKNYAVVRQLVGSDRYESAEALAQLERLYALVRLEVNGYLPVMKLVGKERVGAKVTKRYDVPATPFRRAVAAGVLDAQAQAAFAAALAQAAPGPLALRRQLEAELERLWALRADRPSSRAAARPVAPARVG